MNQIWDATTYDAERRRLVPCYDSFYNTVVELVKRTAPSNTRILDLGAGTGLLSAMLAEHISPREINLVDASGEMLARAKDRLIVWNSHIKVQELTDPLPPGPYGVAVSALAIHHLEDAQKRELFARIHDVLVPGGIFVNAEQILGSTGWHQRLHESVHLEGARKLGSSDEELTQAQRRMSYDRCAKLEAQLEWLREIGFEQVGCFFQWFRFAVYAGWKAPAP